MAASHVKKCIITVYNLTQAQGWLVMFVLLLFKISRNPQGALWNAKEELQFEIEMYQILQILQWFDVIFPLIGFTRTVALNAFLQTAARSIFGFISLPMHHPYIPVTLPILLCLSAGECSRYSYNMINILGLV